MFEVIVSFNPKRHFRYGFTEDYKYFIQIPKGYNFSTTREEIWKNVFLDTTKQFRAYDDESMAKVIENEINEFLRSSFQDRKEKPKFCKNCLFFDYEKDEYGACRNKNAVNLDEYYENGNQKAAMIACCAHACYECQMCDGASIAVHEQFGCLHWQSNMKNEAINVED